MTNPNLQSFLLHSSRRLHFSHHHSTTFSLPLEPTTTDPLHLAPFSDATTSSFPITTAPAPLFPLKPTTTEHLFIVRIVSPPSTQPKLSTTAIAPFLSRLCRRRRPSVLFPRFLASSVSTSPISPVSSGYRRHSAQMTYFPRPSVCSHGFSGDGHHISLSTITWICVLWSSIVNQGSAGATNKTMQKGQWKRSGCLGSTLAVMKKSSKFLPVIGWSIWVLSISFWRKVGPRMKATLKSCLQRLSDFPLPFWLALFVEGTRFAQAKLLVAQEYATSTGLPVPRNVLIPTTKNCWTSMAPK